MAVFLKFEPGLCDTVRPQVINFASGLVHGLEEGIGKGIGEEIMSLTKKMYQYYSKPKAIELPTPCLPKNSDAT